MNKNDNIKIDFSNTNSDMQCFTRNCINSVKIFDDSNKLITKLESNDFSDIDDNNILYNLEKGKKYRISVDAKRPCSINFLRNNCENKIKYIGKTNDDNINYCNGNKNYDYTDEEKKKNNYKHEQDIKETLDSANLLEKLIGEKEGDICILEFKKISQNEIILQGTLAHKKKYYIK